MLTILKGEVLTPIELGELHAWVMRVQAEIQKAYPMLAVLDYMGAIEDADDTAADLAEIQYELDTVAWLIDAESWEVLADRLDTI